MLFLLLLLLLFFFFLIFTFFFCSSKGSHKTEELKHEVRWFFFCWQLQTRYHIFGLCQSGGRSWLEEEEDWGCPSVPFRQAPTQE